MNIPQELYLPFMLRSIILQADTVRTLISELPSFTKGRAVNDSKTYKNEQMMLMIISIKGQIIYSNVGKKAAEAP